MDKKNLDTYENLLTQTLSVLGEAYWIWYPSTAQIKVSKKLFELLGYEEGAFEPTTQLVNVFVHPNDINRVKKLADELRTAEISTFEEQFKILTKDGSYKKIICKAVSVAFDDNNTPLQVVGSATDISEQLKTQEELLLSQRRLKKAQEIALIGNWQETPDIASNFWSNETFNIFGFKPDEALPTLSNTLFGLKKKHAEQIAKFLNFNKLESDQKKFSYEVHYKCPDGEEKFLLIIAEPAVGTTGSILFWQGVVQDITKQKEFERILREDKENLMALVTNMPALVFATDSNGNLVFWNRTCEQLTGYKASELIDNKDALKLLYPETELRRKIRSYLKDMGLSLSSWEHQLTTKKGDKIDIVWSVFSQYVKIEGWSAVAIGYDITHQKKSERLQTAYRFKLEALAETATGFVGMSLTDNVFHYLGTQFEKHVTGQIFMILSLDSDESFFSIEGIYGIDVRFWERIITLLGWNPVGRRIHITPEMTNAFSKGRMVLANRSLYDFSGGIVSSAVSRKVERMLTLSGIHTMGIQKDSKLLGGVVLFAQDKNSETDFSLIEGLTHQAAMAQDRHLVEEQLLAAKEKAEESDRLKTAFLANMSHEIRTPMNAILGFSQLLSIPNLPDEKRNQYISIINTKGNSLVKLINDIIDASKVEAGQLTLAFSNFKVNNLLRQVKQFYEKEKVFQQREALEIRLTLPKRSNSLMIYSDIGRIEQILTNLMNNALKFTEKGFVELGYTVDDKSIVFFVTDSGIGIDSTKQQLIFDRFRQVEGELARIKGGTGLGLSISKGIIEMLGGKIWVESSLGKGAKFYFSLPSIVVKEDLTDEELIQDESDERKVPDWKNLVLLIAEDEEVNYILLNELLEPTGVTILWARDGLQAVELVNSIKKIDAILMDIKMPVMNGYAATMEIRQINANIPIIAQTAYAFTEDRQKAEAAGCDDYLVKPINSVELFDKLDRLMRRKKVE